MQEEFTTSWEDDTPCLHVKYKGRTLCVLPVSCGKYVCASPDGRWFVMGFERHNAQIYRVLQDGSGQRVRAEKYEEVQGTREFDLAALKTNKSIDWAPNSRSVRFTCTLPICSIDTTVRVYDAAEKATVAMLGSQEWRALWRKDGDHAIFSRVLSFL